MLSESGPKKGWLIFSLISFLAYLTPLLSQLFFLHVSLKSQVFLEILFVTLTAGCATGIIGIAFGIGGRVFMIAWLIFFYFDGVFGFRSFLIHEEFSSPFGVFSEENSLFYLSLMAVFLSISSIIWYMRENALQIFGTFVLVSFVSLIFGEVWNAYPVEGKAISHELPIAFTEPVIIHLVFDGMIAADGLPPDIPGSQSLKQLIEQFHELFGFTLFTKSYSTSFSTTVSLARLLNYSFGQSPSRAFVENNVLTTNRHFDYLASKGYRIRIYQRDWPDFCQHKAVSYCFKFSSRANLGVLNRLRSMVHPQLRPFLSLSLIAHPSSIFHRPRFIFHRRGNTVQPLESLLALPEIFENARQAPDGTVIFAHLIIPHTPYAVDKFCNTIDGPPKYAFRNEGDGKRNSSHTRIKAYEAYIGQATCLFSELKRILEDPIYSSLLQRSTIILHGDHGSRVTIGDPKVIESLSVRDTIDLFATHFSVRRPGSLPSIDNRVVSIHQLFYETFDPPYPPWENKNSSNDKEPPLSTFINHFHKH